MTPDASVIHYQALAPVMAEQVLVAWPSFVLIQQGTKQLRLGDAQQLHAGVGNLIAMRSGVQVMSEFKGADGPYRSIIISLSRSFVRDAVGRPTGEPPVGAAAAMIKPDTYLVELARGLADALKPTQSEFDRAYASREFLIQAMSFPVIRKLIFGEVAEWGKDPLQRIRGIMRTHALQPIGVSGYAMMCAMSVSSFKRRFHQAYGESPGNWLTNRRLEHAVELLKQQNPGIADVGMLSGYADTSAFIRAFRRRYNATPLQYRKSVRGGQRTALPSINNHTSQ